MGLLFFFVLATLKNHFIFVGRQAECCDGPVGTYATVFATCGSWMTVGPPHACVRLWTSHFWTWCYICITTYRSDGDWTDLRVVGCCYLFFLVWTTNAVTSPGELKVLCFFECWTEDFCVQNQKLVMLGLIWSEIRGLVLGQALTVRTSNFAQSSRNCLFGRDPSSKLQFFWNGKPPNIFLHTNKILITIRLRYNRIV